jgi:hypothetical protein
VEARVWIVEGLIRNFQVEGRWDEGKGIGTGKRGVRRV